MIDPPISSAAICTASPTDLSCVVLVVLNPMSRMMMVENEFTTPFGMALQIIVSTYHKKSETLSRCTYAAKTLIKSRMVLISKKPALTWLLSKCLFLIPV